MKGRKIGTRKREGKRGKGKGDDEVIEREREGGKKGGNG